MNMTLFLVRGLPGSGKTTWAHSCAPSYMFEADDFFRHRFFPDEKYTFDTRFLKYAHMRCLSAVAKTLFNELQKKDSNTYDISSITVANTFTAPWEMQPYIDLAKVLDVPVVINTLTTQYSNTHNVPEKTIKRMRDRFVSGHDLSFDCYPDGITYLINGVDREPLE